VTLRVVGVDVEISLPVPLLDLKFAISLGAGQLILLSKRFGSARHR
jgi:hypothetical protein